MKEQILNYLDMSEDQRLHALKNLKSIGFYPAYGTEKTMKRIMDQSIPGEHPQYYFVFREELLIGYLFMIGDDQKYKAFPWQAVTNVEELPMSVTTPLMEIQIEAWENIGDRNMADFLRETLANFSKGIDHLPDHLCR
ncbi:MAG: hypothetical protein LUF30_06530 [Lachnospiraceae bacterium]|nr:hypothetical protein [Lachnospiraceae bacterium]